MYISRLGLAYQRCDKLDKLASKDTQYENVLSNAFPVRQVDLTLHLTEKSLMNSYI